MPYPDSNYERSWKMQTRGVMLYPATMQRLIEAAPEMLAALRAMREALPELGVDYYGFKISKMIDRIDLALAKAEGRR